MHVPDFKHLITSADPCEYDCLQESVWERESDGDRRTGDRCHRGKHSGGDCVLQMDGQKVDILINLRDSNQAECLDTLIYKDFTLSRYQTLHVHMTILLYIRKGRPGMMK